MDSETTLFVPEAETNFQSLWNPYSGSSMEGRFQQEQAEGDRNSAGKKRRLTVEQVRLLERNFNVENKLEHERKVQLAEEIGLRPRQVAVWFQNRRARSKTKKIENDYEYLNAEYHKLKKDYSSLLKLNHDLKAEVDELREKWAATEKMKNPLERVELEAMDSSVTGLGKLNTNTMDENVCNVLMGSSRQEDGSRSSSKSDDFYSESPAMQNQSQLNNVLQDEEDKLGRLGKLEDEIYADAFIDSFNVISSAVEDQSLCFWSC